MSLMEAYRDMNLTEAAKEFPQADIDKIYALTDRNDHGGAVKLLAKNMGLKKEEKIMDNILKIHKIEGHMSPNLISYRTEIMTRCLNVAKKKYSNALDIHGAF